jgi:hypothetical protein
MTVHPLDDVRGQVEEGKTSAQWALVAREHAMHTLLETGYFTADDLAVLGMPEHYRRSVHGLVTAFFRGPQPYMEEAGRRKSERPERKGAKNDVFRITAKGRRELPALLRGLRKELTLVGRSAGDVENSSIAPGEIDPPLVGCSAATEVRGGGSSASGEKQAPVVHQQANASEAASFPAPDASPNPEPEPEQIGMVAEPDPKAWAA